MKELVLIRRLSWIGGVACASILGLAVPSFSQDSKIEATSSAGACVHEYIKALAENQRPPADESEPICEFQTESGVKISISFRDYIQDPEDNPLKGSEISSYILSLIDRDSYFGEATQRDIQFKKTEVPGLYTLGASSVAPDGQVLAHSERSVGGGADYAYVTPISVSRKRRVHWLRCNDTPKDKRCVSYSQLFARESPTRSITTPEGDLWPREIMPCYLAVGHTFPHPETLSQIPEAIDAIDAMVFEINRAAKADDAFNKYCTRRGY